MNKQYCTNMIVIICILFENIFLHLVTQTDVIVCTIAALTIYLKRETYTYWVHKCFVLIRCLANIKK